MGMYPSEIKSSPLLPPIRASSWVCSSTYSEVSLTACFFPTKSSWSLLVGLLVVVVFSLVAWFFCPKGENQTYVPPLSLEPKHPGRYSLLPIRVPLFPCLETSSSLLGHENPTFIELQGGYLGEIQAQVSGGLRLF